MRRSLAPFVAALLSSTFLSGCVFQRSVINAGNRNLDLSFIEVGKTTFEEVLENLGPPDIPIKNLRTFQYRSGERRTSMFRIMYFVFLPWAWYDEQVTEKVLIELDEKGVVSNVARSTLGTIRPPLEGEDDRAPQDTEIIQRGRA